jgi:hypothetical protein
MWLADTSWICATVSAKLPVPPWPCKQMSTGYCNGGHVWTFAAFGSSTRNVRPYTMCVPPKSIPPAGGEGGHGGGTHRAQPRQLGQLHELGLATLLASLHQPWHGAGGGGDASAEAAMATTSRMVKSGVTRPQEAHTHTLRGLSAKAQPEWQLNSTQLNST